MNREEKINPRRRRNLRRNGVGKKKRTGKWQATDAKKRSHRRGKIKTGSLKRIVRVGGHGNTECEEERQTGENRKDE